ncbi:uncharacterized protein LOC106365541 [Brassica napus]|uniref:uncharacterized protein LOC106365541 n=1 Tax=Brassica napus TaxID=3708 RepID=UPI0006AB4924|nr:uncharacterized protein LOC106365541 [Brassica napus]
MVGCLVQLLRGVWSQTEYDEWRFQIDPGNLEYRAMVGGSESIESLETTIRQGFTLPPETPITLTYRLPSCMVVPDRNRTPPVTIVSRNDIDIMMGLRQSFSELALCVTTGSEAVARYKLMTSNTPLNNTASFVDEVPNVRAGVGNNGDDGTIYHSKCNNFSTTEETSSTVGWRNNRGPVDNDDLINLVDFSSDGDSDLGDPMHNANELHVGMVFKNREEFKQHIALYAIHWKFRYRTPRSAPEGMVLKCFSTTCTWRVYAVRLKDSETYEVRKMNDTHTCSVDDRSGYQTHATHKMVGEMVRKQFLGNGVGPKPREIRQMMQENHDVRISYWKAWRSREIALGYAKGTSSESYNLLPKYLNNLVAANPGTLAEIHTEFDENIGTRFKYMFLALNASIKGFEYMRKVVVVDGTHLRGKYAGCLLTASTQDGNYQIFPLAIAIVDGENDLSWEWFFTKLKSFVPNNEDVVFVSDRHSSIYYGLSKVYPNARHCACLLHLKRNIKTYYKSKHLGFLVAKAARAYLLSDFYYIFNKIKNINGSCAEYLEGIGFEHWTRSHFKGNRYDIMTSNIAESWNAVLREAREYPVLPLVEFIRSKLMTWFSTRREAGLTDSDGLTPRVVAILAWNFETSVGYNVEKIKELEYEVKNKEGVAFHVYLSDKSCSCYEFQMLQIPCSHAVAAAVHSKIRVESLVAVEYSIGHLRGAYSEGISPSIDSQNIDDINAEVPEFTLFPPACRRPPGRPRKKRFFSRGEFCMKKTRKQVVCSRCKGSGHNRATCKMPI